MGSPRIWPHACARWLFPKRVKSGMFSESVDQNAIMPISAGGKRTNQKLPPQPTLPGSLRIGPKPPAFVTIQASRPNATTSTNGAAQFSKRRTAFIPRTMIRMLIAQKMAKLSHRVQCWPATIPELAQPEPKSLPASRKSAPPPIQVWIPNQPQATPARSRAATLAPKTPKEARAKTGYGMPYLVPAWLFASIGIRTMMLANAIVRIAWYQAMPRRTRPDASR